MTAAGLPMYDLPEVAAATESWWAGLARAFRRQGIDEVPDRLVRGGDPADTWRAPDLLFSQTCGYPLTHALAGRVRVVATPAYARACCRGAEYCSVVAVRGGDPAGGVDALRGRVAAINAPDSQSGYSALRALIAPLARRGRFFARTLRSGGHRASLALLARGAADVCAVDCVVWALLERHCPAELAGLRVLAHAPKAPALPYITRAAAGDDLVARLRAGLFAALDDPDLAEAREALLLTGAEVLPEAAYQRIIEIERDAAALGYDNVA